MQKRKVKKRPPNRRAVYLSVAQEDRLIERIIRRATPVIAKEAAKITVQDLYAQIGQTAIRRVVWIVGLGVGALISAALAMIYHKFFG